MRHAEHTQQHTHSTHRSPPSNSLIHKWDSCFSMGYIMFPYAHGDILSKDNIKLCGVVMKYRAIGEMGCCCRLRYSLAPPSILHYRANAVRWFICSVLLCTPRQEGVVLYFEHFPKWFMTTTSFLM